MLYFFLLCILQKSPDSIQSPSTKVIDCWLEWHYLDLEKSDTLKILLVSYPKKVHMFCVPLLVVGVNSKGDTVAVVDKELDFPMSENDLVIIRPQHWYMEEKQILYPMVTVYKENRYNIIICAVKYAYYGKVYCKF